LFRGSYWGSYGEVWGSYGEVCFVVAPSSPSVKYMILNNIIIVRGRWNLGEVDFVRPKFTIRGFRFCLAFLIG
jgi:hypothetical protein